MSETQPSPGKQVLVINNTERILHYVETSTTTNVVEGKETVVPIHKSRALICGVNLVEDDKWFKAFLESPVCKYHRARRLLEIAQLAADKSGKAQPGLLGFDADEAIGFVNNTFALSLLEEWQKVETRADVKEAIRVHHAYVTTELEAPEQDDRVMFKVAPADASHMRI